MTIHYGISDSDDKKNITHESEDFLISYLAMRKSHHQLMTIYLSKNRIELDENQALFLLFFTVLTLKRN